MRVDARFVRNVALVAAAYFAVARLGLLAAVAQRVVSSAWPPAGFALSVLFLFGPRLWPGVAIGAFLLNATSGVSPLGALVIAVGNTLEAVAGVWMLRQLGCNAPLERLRDTVWLIVCWALLAPLLSATLGVASLVGTGAAHATAAPRLWTVWWSGDALGVLVVAPVFLGWRRRLTPWPPARLAEAAVLVILLVVSATLLFRSAPPFHYLLFPLGSWAALRFGPRGAATAIALAAALTLWHTVRGDGPFVGGDPVQNLFLLQTFLGLLAIKSLLFAAAATERERARRATADSERRMADAQALAHLGSWTWNVADNRVTWSAELCRIYGVAPSGAPADFEGFLALVHSDDREPVRSVVAQSLVTGERFRVEERVVRPDGDVRVLDSVGEPARDAAGALTGFRGVCLDVTERQRAEVAHALSEQRYRLLLEAMPDVIVTASADGTITSLNQEFERMLGRPRADWIGRPFTALLHPDDRAAVFAAFQGIITGTNPTPRIETRFLTASGGTLYVEGRGVAQVENGRVIGAIGAVRDITQRRLAEESLEASRRRLRALSQRLLSIQEAERTRIARELHDQVGAMLSTLMVNLEGLLRRTPEERRRTTTIHTSLALVEDAMELVRTLSFDLRPAMLDDLGLAAAVGAYCRRQAQPAAIGLALRIGAVRALPAAIETACFRVLQEAVANVLRHASARHLTVALGDGDDVLRLDVEDDGVGFDPEAAPDQGPSSQLGILGMRERAELAGGELDVYSAPGAGTRVTARFPLNGRGHP